METLKQDLKFAFRSLRGSPLTTVIVLVTLAIGIGANALIFSAVNAILLRKLPFERPDGLVFLYLSSPKRGVERDVMSVPTFVDLRDQTTCFSGASAAMTDDVTLTGESAVAGPGGAAPAEPPSGALAETASAGYVSPEFFSILGVRPAAGRGFLKGEDAEGAAQVVVLGHGVAQRRFGGDAAALGKRLVVNGVSREVVGITPEGFSFPERTSVYLPAAFKERQRTSRGSFFLPVIARMKPGTTLEQANKQIATVAARIERDNPKTNMGWTAVAVPFREELARDYKLPVLVLLGAVVVVLLIACANVANILLARLSSRAKEISVRLALGASKGRLLRQLLTESALVSILGGAVGVLVAYWSLDLLRAAAPGGLAVWKTIRIDAPVLLYSFLVAVGTGLAFGSVPALHVLKSPLERGLRATGRVIGGSERRSQAILIVAEVALAVVLLSASGLLLKSLRHIQATSPGFDPENVLAVDVSMPDARFPEEGKRRVYLSGVVERIAAIPGVASVSGATTLPLGNNYSDTNVRVTGEPEPPPELQKVAGYDLVLPRFFETMAIPVKRGRPLLATDTEGSPQVAVINKTMSRGFWPGQDALGKTFTIGAATWTVVGIAGDTRRLSVMRPDRPHFYMSYAQRPRRDIALVVKTKSDAAALMPTLRTALRAYDPVMPTDSLRPLARQVSDSVVLPRVVSGLLNAFGLLAMVLAALGLYGVLSYAVSQRTSEIGVRLAIGAQRRDILLLVGTRGLALTGLGLAIGTAAALASTRLLRGLLYEVSPGDPATIAIVALTLTAVAAAACFVPARRAARLDPTVALRSE